LFIDENKLIFDKENCEDCYQEALAWDAEKHHEEVLKQYGRKYNTPEDMTYNYSKSQKGWVAHPNEKMCKNPREEKLRQWRQCDKWRRAPEPIHERKPWQKKFRNKMKQNIDKEEYYKPVNHEYKTYGWLYW
jgi:hypothetical protein